jgi:hypothetical protein
VVLLALRTVSAPLIVRFTSLVKLSLKSAGTSEDALH